MDLADASSTSDPSKYDRVGSWKWLRLPPGTATKKRTRKQGKIGTSAIFNQHVVCIDRVNQDPESQDILHLTASVTCASSPYNAVLSCSSCRAREVSFMMSCFLLLHELKYFQAKRVAKKLAARVRPTRSDSDSGDDPTVPSKPKQQAEDTTSIIQFNCAEVLDFSTGSVVLPLRITCYCRHHREKVGFNVHFTMMDHTGRIVGTGTSRPIMITDDHKTTSASIGGSHNSKQINGVTGDGDFVMDNAYSELAKDFKWAQMGDAGMVMIGETSVSPPPSDAQARAPSKRKQNSKAKDSANKKRVKPYDWAGKRSAKASREASVSSLASPSTSYSALPITRSPTPPQMFSPQATRSAMSPEDQQTFNSLISSGPSTTQLQRLTPDMTSSPSSPLTMSLSMPSLSLQNQNSVPFMYFNPTDPSSSIPLLTPTIHRLIPNSGPTHGGIEVTVLGANFHAALQLNCVFGDVVASSTQRWSDNTLVCILPPRATAGVVAVWFDGFSKVEEQNHTSPSLFTYCDESDRAL